MVNSEIKLQECWSFSGCTSDKVSLEVVRDPPFDWANCMRQYNQDTGEFKLELLELKGEADLDAFLEWETKLKIKCTRAEKKVEYILSISIDYAQTWFNELETNREVMSLPMLID
ncbi:hypothetical protein ACHQM5_020034 [Ranunculus cassubicifolius]